MSSAKPDSVPTAVNALDVPPRARPSNYPPPFAERVAGRRKRVLGDLFGLRNFGINHTTLAPGTASALRHSHEKQDEFIYILKGHPVLVTESGRRPLAPGMCAGFAAGSGDAHHLLNETNDTVEYLEVGDRSAGDAVTYPDDDIAARFIESRWVFYRKNGEPYPES